MKYVDEALRTTAFADMLQKGLFPNTKELTESFGAYNAVRTHLGRAGYFLDDPSITLVAVGDGHTPRTAATFAFRSAWDCHSIDPVIRPKSWNITRLTWHQKPVEDVVIEAQRMVIVCVHSHAPISSVLQNLRGTECRSLVIIPCCNFDTIPPRQPPDIQYDDASIMSEKRHVMIWNQI